MHVSTRKKKGAFFKFTHGKNVSSDNIKCKYGVINLYLCVKRVLLISNQQDIISIITKWEDVKVQLLFDHITKTLQIN